MADFKLGRIKFKWRGDWAVDTSYLIDDVIKYGGNTYVCIQNHTSPSNENLFYTSPGTYTSYWSLQAESLFSKGAYAADTWYKLNDLVKYGARQYRCTTAHTSASTVGGVAILNGSNFELYIEAIDYKGDWTGSTYYKVKDVFKFGGNQYIVDTAHTSGATSDDFDQSVVSLFTNGQEFLDTYAPSTVYRKGDIVTYGGYTYIYVNDEEAAGQTPTDNAYWDVITTGYNNVGEFVYGSAYKTGDVFKYGGYSYVSKTNNTNEYPANTDGTTNTTHFQLLVKGFDYQSGGYDAATTYNIGDVVRHVSSSYVMLKDRQINVTPGTDGTVWQLIAQGDTGAVLTTRGDLIYQDASQSARLPIGTSGSVLTTDGTDPIWSNAEGANVKYVANSGSDSNPGTQFLPFKTLYKALSVATAGDIVDFDTITGGTGGVPATYDLEQTNTTGSGSGATIRVVLDGSSTPTVTITNGGSGHAAGDTVTFGNIASDGSTVQGGGMTDITINVVSASIGDVVYVKNGVYRETLPLRVPPGVTVQGESLRGTEIRPASSTGHQVKTVTITTNPTGASNGTYNHVHGTSTTSTNGIASSFVANVTVSGGTVSSVTIYNGGTGFVASDTITIQSSDIGSGGDLVLTVASLENNDASNMFLVNNQTNIVQMSMRGLTGTPGAGGTSRAAVISLDPSGTISSVSPYIQNCTSFNTNATGVQIDGNLHSSGNKSILCNDFTQINSDGKGVHAIAGGRGEMVSVFTYYNAISYHAESGGFIRGLNCSSAYGEQGAVADGTLAAESPVEVQARGEMLKYATAGFIGAATESDIADTVSTSGTPTAATILGDTSGATADIFRVNISLDYIHIENRTGNFQQGETVTITKDDSSTFQATLDSSFGDSSAAQTGQVGPLIAVKSSDGTLGSANVIGVGANLVAAGDTAKFYRVSAVSETNTSNQTALVRLTESVTTGRAIAEDEEIDVTVNFSNVRLTGHDFLDIGTGGFADTGYPGSPGQPADQADEVTETNGGRVYFSSTDQKGDFRVGDLFRIEQATGVATLNADAFDLSGLSELQLGSIGAELGATINEFSTDETLSNDANSAVPTERAVRGYLTRDKAGTGAWVPPTGTTAQRPTGGELFTGALRYNSSLVTWEGYNGTQWTGLGGGNPWQTTSSSITVAANDRYFVDTSSSALTITLPSSPLTGDQVRLLDLSGTFDTNNLTVARNGNNIMGAAADLTVSTENASIGLVYTGATQGWKLLELA
ncbi:putative tail fiber protein [Pelagibacter phage Mosig EXVC030M]|nr:putative tail fiber protein [Pelagibacter phage Mosig EXVC030M]